MPTKFLHLDTLLKGDTSAVYGYSTSRDFIITEAFRKIGALGDGVPLDSTRLSIGAGVLSPMVQSFSSYGLLIWTLDRITIPLNYWNGQPKLTIGPAAQYRTPYKPLKCLEAVRNDDLSSVDMIKLANRDYETQTNKTTTGVPTMFYYKPNAYEGEIYLWQPPDDYWSNNGSITFVFQRQIQDLTTSTDEPDFPQEWTEALIYQLAIRLAPNYGLAPNDRGMLKQEAKEALALVLGADQEEGSLFIKAGGSC